MKGISKELFIVGVVCIVILALVILIPLLRIGPSSYLNQIRFENNTSESAYVAIFMSNGRVDGAEVKPDTNGVVSLHKSNAPDHDAPNHIRIIITDNTSAMLFNQGFDTTINGGIMRGYPYSVIIDEVTLADQLEKRVSIKLAETEAAE